MTDAPTPVSPAEAADEVARLGSAVLRQAWDPRHLGAIREAIVAFIDRRAARLAAGTLVPFEKMYHTHGGGNFVTLTAAGLLGFTPTATSAVVQIL